jgi:transposase
MPKTRKNPYRAIEVKKVDVAKCRLDDHERVVVAIDIAKKAMRAAVLDGDGQHVVTVKWNHPEQTPEFMGLLTNLSLFGCRVEVVAESTGTYGTALMESVRLAGHDVFLVGTKRSHDAAEVFDGVPSQHDSKDAKVVGLLHLNGCSTHWLEPSCERRDQKAMTRVLYSVQERYQQTKNRLEALLAVYWPGITDVLDLGSKTLWDLVGSFFWSGGVLDQPELAHQVMRSGRGHLTEEKAEEVLASARRAGGLEPTAEERNELCIVVTSLRSEKEALLEQQKRLSERGQGVEAVRRMTPLLGAVTSAVLFAEVGDPGAFHSTGAFLKALGMNLRERSSGKYKGQLKLTKRGPGKARYYAYLCTLRSIQNDPVIRAWYTAKVARDGGKSKKKAVTAVTRKLMRALPHVARGQSFDAAKLFDVTRLEVDFAKAA